MCVHVCVCWRRLGNVSVCYLPLLAGLMSICLKLHNQSCHTDRKLKDPPHPSNRLRNGEFYLKETSEDWKVSYLIYKAFILTEVNSFTAWGANLNQKVSMFKLNMAIKELLMAAIYQLRNGRAKRAEKTTNPNPIMWITDVQGFFFLHYTVQPCAGMTWHHNQQNTLVLWVFGNKLLPTYSLLRLLNLLYHQPVVVWREGRSVTSPH